MVHSVQNDEPVSDRPSIIKVKQCDIVLCVHSVMKTKLSI